MRQDSFQIQGKFIEDSVKIGHPFRYTISVKHAEKQEVFFPSIQQNFNEFEPVKREYFITKTTGQTSLDSAVYTFRLFDMQDSHILRFPIYLMDGQDCTLISPKPDTIFLKKLVKNPTKINLDSLYSQIEIPLLTPRAELKNILSWSVGGIILLSLIYWIFGNKIKQTIKLYLLWRKNLDFRRAFQRYFKNITNSTVGLRNLEKAFTLWKNYLEKLTHIPFSTFTTKEMLDNLNVKHLDKSLNEMDSAIYGGNFSTKTIESLNFLMGIANNIYETERRKIKLESKKK
jgi:hypothetical protein